MLTMTLYAIFRLYWGLKDLSDENTTAYALLYNGDSQGKYTYSQMMFNSWVWKTDNEVDSDALRLAIKNMLTTQVNEDLVENIIKKRPLEERRNL